MEQEKEWEGWAYCHLKHDPFELLPLSLPVKDIVLDTLQHRGGLLNLKFCKC